MLSLPVRLAFANLPAMSKISAACAGSAPVGGGKGVALLLGFCGAVDGWARVELMMFCRLCTNQGLCWAREFIWSYT